MKIITFIFVLFIMSMYFDRNEQLPVKCSLTDDKKYGYGVRMFYYITHIFNDSTFKNVHLYLQIIK